jgi:hypothetical protein
MNVLQSRVLFGCLPCLFFAAAKATPAADPVTKQSEIPKVGSLPAQKPYLNQKHRYPVGNGIMMAVGDANGGWTRLAGPGYTVDMNAASLIKSETISLEVDGADHELTMDIHRAEKTGIYYGVKTYGDLEVSLASSLSKIFLPLLRIKCG